MKQIFLFLTIYLFRFYCNPCQSQNLYGNICHSSYVKKFIVDQDLNYAYSISDDQLIITWDIINGQYINSYSGHRSFLVDINQDENGNIYSVSSTGDIVIQNKYNSSIKQIFNCTNGGVIQNVTKFDSTFNYFLYYDSSQKKLSVFSLTQQNQVLSLSFPQQELMQIIENHQSDFIFFFADGSYVEANIKLNQIKNFKLDPSISNIFDIQYLSLGSMKVKNIQMPSINIAYQVFIIPEDDIMWHPRIQDIYSLTEINKNQMLFYSFQGNYEGIQAISTSNWVIQIEMRCLQLPWNLNVEQSQLIFNQEEDQLITTYVGGASLQDLTSSQFTNQMRIFQQRLILPYQSIIDYNIGVLVFLDNDFINVVNYYTFEFIKFIQFVSNLSKIKADLKYNQSSSNLYVTSSGNNMVQLTVVNLKTMLAAQYNAILNTYQSKLKPGRFYSNKGIRLRFFVIAEWIWVTNKSSKVQFNYIRVN
ncbi:hypothetical protein TTHERM_01058760 (macronuclear) [Tetrahymena thermophila SB210]|uniref:Transmembrane protein n=1 Tax=Tetrahymena thermophila (strain SB210) TaxID=312017 RepID=Q22KY0_TETTS|nr:hypothetical protein TTHERM_01058760 [Tetrahymena thermophila SB210]EAR85904.2 hypothetical protein TTHERM_01058760 [Tetrahymena thermophila SB210]|eukprot:XP_976499.2 hypothetical protein TTHERM_01058760 [Tetrahymena thermophila SB210]